MQKLSSFAVAALAASLFWAPRAHADTIEECGNIYIEAGAECELIPPSTQCKTQCTPITVQAACAAELQLGCEGQCDAEASVECTGSCSGSCEAECEADPGSFDCQGSCEASCTANCDAQCSGSSDQAQCQASCEATCSGSCDAECEAVPPSAECSAQCEASCSGQCDAEANLDCQIDCQSSGYLECVADVQGGCETACESTDGALFCDGQYVDYGGDLEACVAALLAELDIQVEGYAGVECDGNTCEGEAGGSIGCAIGGDGRSALSLSLLIVGALILAGSRRRKS